MFAPCPSPSRSRRHPVVPVPLHSTLPRFASFGFAGGGGSAGCRRHERRKRARGGGMPMAGGSARVAQSGQRARQGASVCGCCPVATSPCRSRPRPRTRSCSITLTPRSAAMCLLQVLTAVESLLEGGAAPRQASVEIALGKLTREGGDSPSVWLHEAATWESRLRAILSNPSGSGGGGGPTASATASRPRFEF